MQTFSWPVMGSREPVEQRSAEQVFQEAYAAGYEQGRAEGHDAGYADGLAKSEAEIEAKLQPIGEALNALQRSTAGYDEEERAYLAEFLQSCFEALLDHELRLDDGVLDSLIAQAQRHRHDQAPVRIKMSPNWCESSRDVLQQIACELVADESLADGDVTIEYDQGSWQVRPVSELQQLLKQILLETRQAPQQELPSEELSEEASDASEHS